jgi:acyl-CoA thioesterase FadM
VNLIFRTLLQLLRSRRASRLGVHDVGRTNFRVVPTDLDVLGHMNNGVYLSIMDLARMDLMIRAGVWARLRALGFYPVVSNETISFRKSLQPWQRFTVESRIVGYDAKAVFVEQRFVVRGELYAKAFMRGRFLKKSGGTVSIAELSDALGVDTAAVALPAWLARWSDDVVLPPTKVNAPSSW